jgi:hypothetical protein
MNGKRHLLKFVLLDRQADVCRMVEIARGRSRRWKPLNLMGLGGIHKYGQRILPRRRLGNEKACKETKRSLGRIRRNSAVPQGQGMGPAFILVVIETTNQFKRGRPRSRQQ